VESTTYYWQVRARGPVPGAPKLYADGGIWWSFRTIAEPEHFMKQYPSDGSLEQAIATTLVWDYLGPLFAYEYCIDTIDNDSCDTSWIGTGTSYMAYPGILEESTTYYWQVRASGPGEPELYADNGIWWSFRTIAKPGGFRKLSPPSAANYQPTSLMLDWEASPRGITYEYCLDTIINDSCDTSWVSRGVNTYATVSGLDATTCYEWQVQAINGYGTTEADYGAWHIFCTSGFKSILLVDDDDNAPDYLSSYTSALDNLGYAYDVFDTHNSDSEPSLAELSNYRIVIWFSGMEEGGYAGPGALGELALGDWLDSGKCLLLSSQDYYKDNGLTAFMQDYLGVHFVADDVGQVSVTGTGNVFSGYGPYTLIPPANPTDRISRNFSAQAAFMGSQGVAGITKAYHGYKTAYLGFPLERVSSTSDRQDVLNGFLNWCNTAPESLNSGWRTAPVTQDGVIHPSEWADAYHYDITMPDYPLPVTLHLKNDAQHLYFAIDNLNVIDNEWQYVVFYFDDNPLPSDAQWGNTTCGNADGEGGIWFWYAGTNDFLEWTSTGSCAWLTPVPGVSAAWSLSGGHRGVEGIVDLGLSPLRASPGDRFLTKIGFLYKGTSQGKIPGLDWAWNDPAYYIYMTLGTEESNHCYLPGIFK